MSLLIYIDLDIYICDYYILVLLIKKKYIYAITYYTFFFFAAILIQFNLHANKFVTTWIFWWAVILAKGETIE